MNWTQAVNAYCERMGPGYWAEPVNALTNLAFMAVALWLWPRTRGIERVLAVLLFVIGVGSWVFHTHAEVWAGVADVIPILLFILVYVFAANRRVLAWPVWAASAGVVAFLPYAAGAGAVFSRLPGFAISAPYWPVPLLIAGYAVALRRSRPTVARGFAIGAVLLCLSLVARSLDEGLCAHWPMGTHFAWHLLNAAMLGWMIAVLRRHRLEPQGAGG